MHHSIKAMKPLIIVMLLSFTIGSCTNTRYITDQNSINRQKEMQAHRTRKNLCDVLLNIASIFISYSLDIDTGIQGTERAFRHMNVINESNDTLIVNMVTDVFWQNEEYCDIMSIELPPQKKQKLLVPYPVAYNIYFRTNYSEEEKMEITTDKKSKKIALRSGMTFPNE